MAATEQTIIDMMDQGFCVIEVILDETGRGADYRFLDVNPAFERQTGLADAVGRSVKSLVPEHEQHWFDTYARVALTGESIRFENGAEALGRRWFEVHAFRVGEPDQLRVAVIFTDESRRKAAETALRAAADRQAFLVRLSDRLRPLIDPLDLQGEATRMLGEHLGASRVFYSEIEGDGESVVVERDYTDAVGSVAGRHRLDDFGPTLRRRFQGGETVALADATRDGGITAAERAAYGAVDVRAFVGVPLVKAGRFVAMLGVHDRRPRQWTADELETIENVAERTWAAVERARAEAALRDSDRRYRTLFDTIDQGFCVVEVLFDPAGHPADYRFVEVNRAFEQQTGLREPQGRTARELVPDLEEFWFDVYGGVAASGEPARFVHGSDAMGRWFDVYAFRAGPATARHVAILFTDITGRRRAEEQLRQADRMEAAGRLAGGVAHEANNQMSVVLGSAEFVLARRDIPAEVRSDVEQIRRAALRTAAVTAQLLAFGRRQLRRPVVLDLNALIGELAPALRRTLGETSRLVLRLAPTPAWIRADRGQLEQVLVNLTLNARDAMRGGGVLTIGTATVAGAPGPNDDRVHLEVTDTGIGIVPKDQPHIFEPFFTTKEVGEGSGLGLASVYGIVQQSGGTIAVRSAPGDGAVFAIELPQADPPDERGGAEPIRVAFGSGQTILVVEDDEALRTMVTRTLALAGYRVLVAEDGRAALETAERCDSPVDLVLTDLAMPQMSGQVLAARLRSRFPGIRVVYMSGYPDIDSPGDDRAEAGARFVQKPFTPDQITAVVGGVLRGR